MCTAPPIPFGMGGFVVHKGCTCARCACRVSAMTYTDYPRWDDTHAATLADTDDVHVDIDSELSDDGATLIIRRTVWSKAHRRNDRHILWIGEVARIPREQAPTFVRDIVSALI